MVVCGDGFDRWVWDVVPETIGGRVIASILIAVGIGVCGFVAGFMTKLMSPDHTEEEQHLKDIEVKLDVLQEQIEHLLELQKQASGKAISSDEK